jgi:very-short-patch-repair endonuclease
MSGLPRDGRVPPTPGPSPTRGEGWGRGEVRHQPRDPSWARWSVGPGLKERMKEAAREQRKTATATEAILWQALRGARLDGRKFRRQQAVGPFVVDFYCASERLVVEVDGAVHEGQREEDRRRQSVLETLGLRVLRLPADSVETDLPSALAAIRDAFSDRAAVGPAVDVDVAVEVLPSPPVAVGEGPGEGAPPSPEGLR